MSKTDALAIVSPVVNADKAATPLKIRRRVRVDGLSALERAELGPQLYEVFCQSYGALDQAVVLDEIVFREGALLVLIEESNGRFAGFGTARIHEIQVAGKVHRVFEGGLYFARHIRRGGTFWRREALRIAMVERLRHPLTPMHLVIEALTPVSYRTAVRTFPRVFPGRHCDGVEELAEVLTAVIDQRGLDRPTANPFVVRYPDPATHQDLDRIQGSSRLRADPDIVFYVQQAPDYEQGDILCCLVPLYWSDLVATGMRLAFNPNPPAKHLRSQA